LTIDEQSKLPALLLYNKTQSIHYKKIIMSLLSLSKVSPKCTRSSA